MLRQSDAQVFKKYSQMKLQMKREALEKLNRRAIEMSPVVADTLLATPICSHGAIIPLVHSLCTDACKVWPSWLSHFKGAVHDKNPSGHHKNLKTAWRKTLKRAAVPYFRIYDLRSTYATRLSAGGVADEWVTQLLRQGDAKGFKKYSQIKLQMKREALEKMNRQANEMPLDSGTATIQ
jgi:integrase